MSSHKKTHGTILKAKPFGYQDPRETLQDIGFGQGQFSLEEPILRDIRDTSARQKCGGGCRVIRKAVPE